MDLKELITAERAVYLETKFSTKQDLLASLLERVLKLDGILEHKEEILATLLERESTMSTGIGQGIAIPHCSSVHEEDLSALVCVLKDPIEFQSVDEEPVKIVILLLLPKDKFEKHIKTLASIARQFNNTEFRDRVASATSSEQLLNLINPEAKKPT